MTRPLPSPDLPETLVADAALAAATDAATDPAAPLASVPCLRLPAELTIYTAAETRSAWLEWLAGEAANAADGNAVCTVDAAAVDEVDAAGVQLLVALSHSLAHQRLALRLHQPSHPLRTACVDLGLAAWLPDDPGHEDGA